MNFCRILVVMIILLGLPQFGMCQETTKLQRSSFPPVLMYHDIKEKPLNGFDVSIADFGKQLDWLAAQGYKTLSIDEFVDHISRNEPFEEKSVLITFDDGYAGIYTYAAPELHKRNMKATFFIFKEGIGTSIEDYPYITEEQMKEMNRDPLFSIQSHTLTHADLPAISADQLRAEIKESRAYFSGVLGKPCRTIAFPYGHYNKFVLDTVQQAGYEAAFSVSDRGLRKHDTRFSIPRIYMGVAMGKDDMKLFKFVVTNYRNMPKEAFVERFGPLPK